MKSDYVIYTSDVVLLVVMLSSLCGNHDCREHAQFYFIYNPILQYIIPDMPSPKWMISAEEIRSFLKMIHDDEFSSMFRQYFSDAINTTAKMIEFLNSRHLDYIMAVKTNLSNRPAVMAMEKYISELTDKTQNTSSHYHEVRTDKEGSRIEEKTYDIVPIEALYNLKDNDGNDILTKDKILPNTRTVI
ncbi:MAG: hypothetical protein SPE82_01550 [Succinivibrio sp.]|nr:hypothetical protein [Succinivibrio sp.]